MKAELVIPQGCTWDQRVAGTASAGRPTGDGSQRLKHVSQAVRALETARTGGAVLVGEPGVGKTYSIRKVLARLDSRFTVTTLHASPFFSDTPFGVLGPLLSDADDAVFSSPLLISRVVSRALLGGVHGQRALLVVDDAQHLDDQSAAVLAQLSQRPNGIVVLAATTDLARLGPELMSLWRDGSLTRIDLKAFDAADAALALSEEFGHRFATSTVMTLWEAAEGNPSYLSSLARQQIAAGTVRKVDGIWVFVRHELSVAGVVRDLIKGRFLQLEPERREVVELLALTGGVTLHVLMHLVNPRHVDDIKEMGLVSVDGGHDRVVRIANPMVLSVVRNLVPPGRGCDLLARLLAAGETPWADQQRNLAYVLWSLNCGASSASRDHVLAAARTANDDGDGATAQRLLSGLAGEGDLREVIERARALVLLGRYAEAGSTLGAFAPGGEAALAPTDRIRLILLRARVTVMVDGVDAARRFLRSVSAMLREDAAFRGLELATDVTLAEADLAAWSGDYNSVVLLLSALDRDFDQSADTAGEVAAVLAESFAVLGRHRDAGEHAARATSLLSAMGIDAGHRALPYLIRAHVVAGSMSDLAGVIAVSEERNVPRWRSTLDLARGLVHLKAGHPGEALTSLVPAEEWLGVDRDEFGLLGLARQATRSARIARGDGVAVDLASFPSDGRRVPWLNERLTTWLRHTSSIRDNVDVTSAAQAIAEAADVAERAPAIALRLLLVAFRQDPSAAADKLQSIAREVDGFLGTLGSDWVAAYRRCDCEDMLALCHLAQQQGLDALARDIALVALDCATTENNRNAVRMAQRAVRSLNPAIKSQDAPGRSAFALFALTSREREVAVKAAAGSSNRRIAEQMHVSVRTVEGHLYQVYAKLHVSNRTELRQAFGGTSR